MSSPSTRLPRILGATLALGLGIFAAVPAGGAFAASAPSTPAPLTAPSAVPAARWSFGGVPLAADTTTAAVAVGTGRISGTVSFGDNDAPESTPEVGLFTVDGLGNVTTGMREYTDGWGRYTFAGIAPGAYYVAFRDTSPETPHASELYSDSITLESATIVRVGNGTDTTGIDAELTFAGPVPTSRIAGADRYATSAAASAQFPTFAAGTGTVYIASGANFPDALSAAPAAAKLGGPLLLTAPDVLPAVISDEITRLAPHQIVVVGGVNAVSASVYDVLATLAPAIERQSGADRYETSRIVAAAAFAYIAPPVTVPPAASTGYAFIANGGNFPDALGASSAAGKNGVPVILVNGAAYGVDDATKQLLTDLKISSVGIAGGIAAISAGIEGDLGVAGYSNHRYDGADRYETSLLINNSVFSTAGIVFLAVGTGYADALSGGALAAAYGAPMFITPGNCIPVAVLKKINSLGASQVVLLGGPNALSDSVANLTRC